MPAIPTVLCIYCMSIFVLIGKKVTERSVSVWDQMEKKAAYCVFSIHNYNEQKLRRLCHHRYRRRKKQLLQKQPKQQSMSNMDVDTVCNRKKPNNATRLVFLSRTGPPDLKYYDWLSGACGDQIYFPSAPDYKSYLCFNLHCHIRSPTQTWTHRITMLA